MTVKEHWLSQIKLGEWYSNAQYNYRPRNDKERNLMHSCYEEGYNTGFSNGLSEGKPKWHDLREDPTDLPPRIKGYAISAYVFSDNGNLVYYDYKNKMFVTYMITPIKVIAWTELPKFKE